jgi:type IV secretory pathway VirB10-like protein
MNLFGSKPPTSSTPTVSTEPAEPRLGFWQSNRKIVYLFAGCVVLLVTARACNSHQKQAQQVQKSQHIEQQTEREQTDKSNAIASLQSQLFNAQRTVQAAQQAAQTPDANPLTPAQMQQMAVAGVGTLPPSMMAGTTDPALANAGGLQRTALAHQPGYSPDSAPHVSSKPVSLVISYRQEEGAGNSGTEEGKSNPGAPAAHNYPAPPAAYVPPQMAAPTPESTAPQASRNPVFAQKSANPEDQQHQLAASTGEKYRIREGTWIPCTEQLRINGYFAGNINCLVSIPIYSTSGQHLLIPQGTVALGHAAAVNGQNQQRLFVVFDEFIMPDGYTVNYDNAAGLDQVGQTGLRDQVNHHYLQMFGVSVGLAALSGLSEIGNYGNSAITAGSQYRAGVTQGLSESSVHILDKFTNILPTFVIREGARNNIHLPFNLWLPDYSKHTMPRDM